MYIGTKIKMHLCQKSFTQKYVCKGANLNYNLFNGFLNGRVILTDDELLSLCNFLELDYNNALSGNIVELKEIKPVKKTKLRKKKDPLIPVRESKEIQQIMTF